MEKTDSTTDIDLGVDDAAVPSPVSVLLEESNTCVSIIAVGNACSDKILCNVCSVWERVGCEEALAHVGVLKLSTCMLTHVENTYG